MSLFDSIGGLVGLGGGQGQYYQAPALQSKAKDTLNSIQNQATNADVENAGQGLSNGTMSLQDALSKVGGDANSLSALASNPVYGTALANNQVANSSLLGGLLGQGGSLQGAEGEEKNLMNSGYNLQPQDYDAMGQASNNIARQFGAQENSLANALASRGLASGSNGASAQSFSNLYGNKYEQLGQMQQQIAQQRVQDNMNRLQQTRAYEAQLGGLANQAEGQTYNQNQTRTNQLQNQQGLDTNAYSAQNAAMEASQKDKESQKQLGLSDVIGQGIGSGVNGLFQGAGGAAGNNIVGGKNVNVKSADNTQNQGQGPTAANAAAAGLF